MGLQVKVLKDSFELLAPKGDELVKNFYDKLFSDFPGVIPLFANTTREAQEKKLLSALAAVVGMLRSPRKLSDTLKEMGKRHEAYGALPEHYPAVRDTLLAVMKKMAGKAWTSKVNKAWTEALNTIAEIMISAYESNKNEGVESMSESNVDRMMRVYCYSRVLYQLLELKDI